MARLRPARCYRDVKRPYTRVSRVSSKSFIRGVPGSRIVKYHSGNLSKDYDYVVKLVSKQDIQIRHNALEAARVLAHKYLEKTMPKNYHLWIKVYPHHVMRENPLATGAGADRYQTGMSHPFGKPIGRAAQVSKGQDVIVVLVDEGNVEKAKEILKKAAYKLPMKYSVVVEKVKR